MKMIELKFCYHDFKIHNPKKLATVCASLNKKRIGALVAAYLSQVDLDFSDFLLENLNNAELKEKDLGSESWGADLLDGNIIEMRSLFDFDNINRIDYITRADFTRIIEKWQEFLKREPDENYEEIITFEIEELDREKLHEIWNKELLLTHRKNKMTVIAGGHSALGNIRVDRVIHKYRNGVYIAQVSVLDPVTEQYIAKSNNNGETVMFPEYWTADRIKVEINSAYYNQIEILNKARKAEGMWMGVSTSGVKIEGYTYPKVTAFPSAKQD